MADQKVLEYMKSMLDKGYGIEDIKKKLLEVGWPMKDVEECAGIIRRIRPEPTGRVRIKSNFPTIIKPRLIEDVYKSGAAPGAVRKEKRVEKAGTGSKRFTENRFLVAGVLVVVVGVIALLGGVFLFMQQGSNAENTTVIGLSGFTVPDDGVLYAGATGTLKITLKNTGNTIVMQKIEVNVRESAGSTSPGILMKPGSQNSFIIYGLPVLRSGESYNAQVNVAYRDIETGAEFKSSGTIAGRAE